MSLSDIFQALHRDFRFTNDTEESLGAVDNHVASRAFALFTDNHGPVIVAPSRDAPILQSLALPPLTHRTYVFLHDEEELGCAWLDARRRHTTALVESGVNELLALASQVCARQADLQKHTELTDEDRDELRECQQLHDELLDSIACYRARLTEVLLVDPPDLEVTRQCLEDALHAAKGRTFAHIDAFLFDLRRDLAARLTHAGLADEPDTDVVTMAGHVICACFNCRSQLLPSL